MLPFHKKYNSTYNDWDTDSPLVSRLFLDLRMLEGKVAYTLRQIEEAKHQLDVAHNLTRPVSRLPAELLSRIFELAQFFEEMEYGRGRWCYWDDEMRSDSNSGFSGTPHCTRSSSAVPFELRISQVCRTWKSVAEGTYTLWQTLVIPRFEHYHYVDNTGEIIERYVKSSKNAEISIRIHVRSFVSWEEMSFPLRPTIHRWKRFSVSSSHWSPHQITYRILARLEKKTAPILEDLCFYQIICSRERHDLEDMRTTQERAHGLQDDDENLPHSFWWRNIRQRTTAKRSHHPLIVFRGGAPKLKSLRTSGLVVVVGDLPNSDFPNDDLYTHPSTSVRIMPSLTTLCVHNVTNPCWHTTSYDLVAVLVSCPSIQNLSIKGDVTDAINHNKITLNKYTLPSIRSLRFSPQHQVPSTALPQIHIDLGIKVFTSFFRTFGTPNLEFIAFTGFRNLVIPNPNVSPMPWVKTIRLENCFSRGSFIHTFNDKFPHTERLDLVYNTPDPYTRWLLEVETVNIIFNDVVALNCWPLLSEVRVWVDSPDCYNILTLRKLLDEWNRDKWEDDHAITDLTSHRKEKGWARLKLKIPDIPRGMPKWLLKDHVHELEVLDPKYGRPGLWE